MVMTFNVIFAKYYINDNKVLASGLSLWRKRLVFFHLASWHCNSISLSLIWSIKLVHMDFWFGMRGWGCYIWVGGPGRRGCIPLSAWDLIPCQWVRVFGGILKVISVVQTSAYISIKVYNFSKPRDIFLYNHGCKAFINVIVYLRRWE